MILLTVETTKQSPDSDNIYSFLNSQLSAKEVITKRGEWEADIQTDNEHTAYDNALLTHNLGSKWPRMANHGEWLPASLFCLPLLSIKDQPKSQICSLDQPHDMPISCFLMSTTFNQSIPEAFKFWQLAGYSFPTSLGCIWVSIKKKKKKKDDYWLPCYSKLWINNLGLFSSGWTLFISLAPQGAHSLWRETVLNISHMNISYTTELYTKRDWGSSKKGLIDFFPSLAHFIVSLVFTFGEECCSSLRILVNLC